MHKHICEPPKTPKSSNRRCHKALSGWASCPSFRCEDEDHASSSQSPTRSDSISPLRPKQLAFEGRSTSGNCHGGGGGTHHDTECHPYTSSSLHSKSINRPKSPHSIYRKSIARGNAWNAKGLKKASEGYWIDALACWENALEIRRHLLGPYHVDVASTLNNQGIALGKIGKYDEAVMSLNQALKTRMELWNKSKATTQQQQQQQCDCTTILSTLHNLANVHQQAGKLDEAFTVLEEARTLGNEHVAPNMPRARIAVTLGHLYWMAHDDSMRALPSTASVALLEKAKEALLEARMFLLDERQLQQRQLLALKGASAATVSATSSEEAMIGAILTTQQELHDVERDLDELHSLTVNSWR